MSRTWCGSTRGILLLLVFSFAWGTAHAAPSPQHRLFDLGPLSKQQRLEDFAWITSTIEEQYAPLELKEKTWNFNWEDLKKTYRERISRDQ